MSPSPASPKTRTRRTPKRPSAPSIDYAHPIPQQVILPPDSLTLRELLLTFWGSWKFILGCTLLASGLSIFYAWRATPIYQLDAMLQIEVKKGVQDTTVMSPGTEGSLASELGTETQSGMEILKSNLVLGRAVEALDLDVVANPESSRLFGFALMRGRLDAPAIEVETLEAPRGQAFHLQALGGGEFLLKGPNGQALAQGRVGDEVTATWQRHPIKLKVRSLAGKPGQGFLLERQHVLTAIEAIRRNLSVAEKGKQTNILGLTFLYPQPARGAEILNAVLDQYIRQNIERKAEEASKALAFLQEQMPLLKGKLEVAEERLNHFRSGSLAADLSEEARLVLKQSVDLEAQILALHQKKEEVLRTYQENSPVVSTLNQQISKLQEESHRLEGQTKSLPRTQQEVVRLMREVQVDQELYTALMNNRQRLQVTQAGEIGNARIVDYATPSLLPVKPQKPVIIGLGTFFGLLVGVGGIMLHRSLRHGVENPQEVESALGLPVLITIPHSRNQASMSRHHKEAVSPLASVHPEDLAVESLRSLRTSLPFTLVDVPNRVVVIAGPSPDIGKSFVSANFATVLAQGGARVLLIDADLRKGKLHRKLGFEDCTGGLSEILSGQVDWQSTLRESAGFQFISSGFPPPNPSELLMGPRLGTVLAEAASLFDFILLDTPPLLAVTDAVLVGTHAGSVLLTLKAGQHSLEEIRTALQRLGNAGIRPKGVIFNDIQPLSAKYGYHTYTYRTDAEP